MSSRAFPCGCEILEYVDGDERWGPGTEPDPCSAHAELWATWLEKGGPLAATPCTCDAFARAVEAEAITEARSGGWALTVESPVPEVAVTAYSEPVRFCPFCGAPAREVNR